MVGIQSCILPIVMAGLVPAIHVFLQLLQSKTWMPGTRPGMTSYSQSFVSELLSEISGASGRFMPTT
jgi:hypothetical protein